MVPRSGNSRSRTGFNAVNLCALVDFEELENPTRCISRAPACRRALCLASSAREGFLFFGRGCKREPLHSGSTAYAAKSRMVGACTVHFGGRSVRGVVFLFLLPLVLWPDKGENSRPFSFRVVFLRERGLIDLRLTCHHSFRFSSCGGLRPFFMRDIFFEAEKTKFLTLL